MRFPREPWFVPESVGVEVSPRQFRDEAFGTDAARVGRPCPDRHLDRRQEPEPQIRPESRGSLGVEELVAGRGVGRHAGGRALIEPRIQPRTRGGFTGHGNERRICRGGGTPRAAAVGTGLPAAARRPAQSGWPEARAPSNGMAGIPATMERRELRCTDDRGRSGHAPARGPAHRLGPGTRCPCASSRLGDRTIA